MYPRAADLFIFIEFLMQSVNRNSRPPRPPERPLRIENNHPRQFPGTREAYLALLADSHDAGAAAPNGEMGGA